MELNELKTIIYSKIDELPTLPIVLPKLINLIENPKSSASDISEVISRDPAMTSKILKVANSAYYGFSQKISAIDHAVTLLGFNMVKSLALSIGIMRTFPQNKKKSPHFSQEGLWLHSLAVATILHELGNRISEKNTNESLFIIGLLHDIGKIVLDQFLNDLFQEALTEANELNKGELFLAERKVIGFDHGDIGALLLTRWKFPETIINPISAHHKTEISEGTNAEDIAMLRIANFLAQHLGMGEEGNPIPTEIHKEDLDILDFQQKDIDEMIAYSNGVKDGIFAFFHAMN